MYTDHEILVKRSDLLPVADEGGNYFLAGGMVVSKDMDPDELEQTALRHLSAAVYIRDLAAEEVAKEAKEWELEHAVPLARKMHDTFHKYSDNYRDSTAEELWLHNYKERNHLVLKWVATASAALKAQEGSK